MINNNMLTKSSRADFPSINTLIREYHTKGSTNNTEANVLTIIERTTRDDTNTIA